MESVSAVKDGENAELTVDAVERAIPALIAEGYQLVTVSELLTYGGEELVPGKVYFKR